MRPEDYRLRLLVRHSIISVPFFLLAVAFYGPTRGLDYGEIASALFLVPPFLLFLSLGVITLLTGILDFMKIPSKQTGYVVLTLGAIFSLVPFYFKFLPLSVIGLVYSIHPLGHLFLFVIGLIFLLYSLLILKSS